MLEMLGYVVALVAVDVTSNVLVLVVIVVVEEVAVVLLVCALDPEVDAVVDASVLDEALELPVLPKVGDPLDAVACEVLDDAAGEPLDAVAVELLDDATDVLAAIVLVALAVEAFEMVDAVETLAIGVTVAPDVDAELVCVHKENMYIHLSIRVYS